MRSTFDIARQDPGLQCNTVFWCVIPGHNSGKGDSSLVQFLREQHYKPDVLREVVNSPFLPGLHHGGQPVGV